MRRSLTPELMDDPGLDPREHARALRALAGLNRLAGGARILWGPVREAARGAGGRVRVLDIATGSADVPLALARRAAREGLALDLHACDVSEAALRLARERALGAGVMLHAWRQDAVKEPFTERYDIVTCSLFLHHLDQEGAVAFLRNAAGATGGVLLVSDLRRDAAGLAAAWATPRVLSRSRIVKVDAVKSVRAAFTMEEALELAGRAGLEGARVCARWPWRMLLTWRRD